VVWKISSSQPSSRRLASTHGSQFPSRNHYSEDQVTISTYNVVVDKVQDYKDDRVQWNNDGLTVTASEVFISGTGVSTTSLSAFSSHTVIRFYHRFEWVVVICGSIVVVVLVVMMMT
jgi:hypothetical protein